MASAGGGDSDAAKRFLKGATLSFLLLLVGAEVASRGLLRSGFLYRRFDFSGTLTSLPELRDRIAWSDSLPHPVFLLGDSVLGASALMEHRTRDARDQTIPAFLARDTRGAGVHVESLGADGLLVPDLEAISGEVAKLARPRLLIVLNVRMFAAEFSDPAKAVSRDFLLPDLVGVLPDPHLAATADSLDQRLSRGSVDYSFLLRTTRLLQPLWYFPTRRDFFRRLLEPDTGSAADADVREAALRLKVAPYYRDRWSESSLPFAALGQLLENLRATERAVIVLTPQNADFIDDAATFAWNRATLKTFIASRAPRSLSYEDLADRYPPTSFLDHCHLTAAGNRDYARTLARLLLS